MRKNILYLSILSLIVGVAWAVSTSFKEYEPIIAIITGLIGLVSIFKTKTSENENDGLRTSSKVEGSGNANVSINFGSLPKADSSIDNTTNNDKNQDSRKDSEALSREEKLDMMKKDFSILFIDDDERFKMVNILKDAGWKKTKSVIDIKGIDIAVVRDRDVFFVDINGVGKLLGCEGEGLDLAYMLKERYPDKRVVVYSAEPKNNIFHDGLKSADYILEKNALPYEFQKLVELYSLEKYSKIRS